MRVLVPWKQNNSGERNEDSASTSSALASVSSSTSLLQQSTLSGSASSSPPPSPIEQTKIDPAYLKPSAFEDCGNSQDDSQKSQKKRLASAVGADSASFPYELANVEKPKRQRASVTAGSTITTTSCRPAAPDCFIESGTTVASSQSSDMTAGGRAWNARDDGDSDEFQDEEEQNKLINKSSATSRIVILENEPPRHDNGAVACPNIKNNINGSLQNRRKRESSFNSNDSDENEYPDSVMENNMASNSVEDDEFFCADNEDANNKELLFSGLLKKERGLEVVPQEGDGNCLFRAIALQVYGDAGMHNQVRQQCCDFMARDPNHFGAFISNEPFDAYIQRKRQDAVHGNHTEIQACSELFNRPVQVFTVDSPLPSSVSQPLNIFHGDYKTADPPIRLSFHGNHYNAIIDPLVPTAGLGLGLPGLRPGLADQLQVSKAVAESDADADLKYALKESQDDEFERVLKESEQDALQRAIKESSYSMQSLYQNKALALSDIDATNFELEQTVLVQSLQTYCRNECRKQSPAPQLSANELDSKSKAMRSTQTSTASASASAVDHPSAAIMPSSWASLQSGSPVASAASASASAAATLPPSSSSSPQHSSFLAEAGLDYPPVVQELVVNGFDRAKVIHAFELIGDNFDDLLAFLMQTS